MEIKLAAFSPNAAIASTAQSVASGIEKAASLPGGVGGIADTFQNIPAYSPRDPSKSALAPFAMMDFPAQYSTRLQDFHREASGLVSSSDLTEKLKDPNLDVIKGVNDFRKQLQSLSSDKKSEIAETENKIEREKEAAALQFGLSVASAAAATGLGAAGAAGGAAAGAAAGAATAAVTGAAAGAAGGVAAGAAAGTAAGEAGAGVGGAAAGAAATGAVTGGAAAAAAAAGVAAGAAAAQAVTGVAGAAAGAVAGAAAGGVGAAAEEAAKAMVVSQRDVSQESSQKLQRLLDAFNQTESLASTVQKKINDQSNSMIKNMK